MPDYPHLPNAPIQEAVIDLRVKLPKRFEPEAFAAVYEALGDRFPEMHERRAWEGRIEVRGERPTVSDQGRSTLDGYIFQSEDGKMLAQFRVNGFSFHRLRPYGTWRDLFEGAREFWPIYVGVAHPEAVVRIAVRYINRFEIPVPTQLEQYLVTPVDLPSGVEGTLTSFLWKVGFSERDTPLRGTMTQASEVKPDERTVDIILDIDCFATDTYDSDDDAIWDVLDGLRELKNRIFFNALTPKAVEMFR